MTLHNKISTKYPHIAIVILSAVALVVALPLLIVPPFTGGTIYIAGLLMVLMVVIRSLKNVPNPLDDFTFLYFDSQFGPDSAYYSGIFYEPKSEARSIVERLIVGNNPGYIYIMRRTDGIYKVGRTDNTNRRQREHIEDYGLDFVLVRRFVVADAVRFEKLALRLTAQYTYFEEGRQELRVMDSAQLEDFLELFDACCKVSVST